MRYSILVLSFAGITGSSAFADSERDAPKLGILYNTLEKHSMTYRCDPPSNDTIKCEFVQTAVREKSTFADLPDQIAKGKKEFASSKPLSSDECKASNEVLQILEGTKAPPKPAAANITPLERSDMLAYMQAVTKLCATSTEENYLNLVRVVQEKERRTCKVSSNSFTQTFTRRSNGGPKDAWIADGRPVGDCGIVDLSRFEAEVTPVGTSTMTNWKYVARKAITNPQGPLMFGLGRCSQLDEKPYVYDWRAKEHAVHCDYVEFSPI